MQTGQPATTIFRLRRPGNWRVSSAVAMQLVIRGGTVVSAEGQFQADIGVRDGVIAQLGGDVPAGEAEIDATGKLVLPGGVDIHTHLSGTGNDLVVDGFESGSRAAAAGGVTTVCDFAYQRDGEGLEPAIERAHADGAHSLVDYTFHVVLRDPSPEALDEISGLPATGHSGLKVFMSTSRFAKRARDYARALEIAGAAGVLTAIHAEDDTVIDQQTRALLESGRTGVEWFPDSRPPLSEEVAVRQAIGLAESAGAPIYLVHLSSQGALAALAEARSRGLPVFGETRPIYLYLTRDVFSEEHAGRFVGHPPLRGADDVEAVWNALRSGLLSTVCSDHITYSLATKMNPAHTFATVPPGMANLETQLPMLYSEGVRTGRISIERLVAVLCTNPAKLAGLAPRKGVIAPGADADLLVFDPNKTRTIHAPEMQSAADYDIFEGREVTGWPAITISRGEVIFEDGKVVAGSGRGQFVPRSKFVYP